MPFPEMYAALARALAERGYEEPTAVQSAVLQPEAVGRDLLVSAQTGSGKTVAFGVALASTLMGEAERFGNPGLPLALIVAPTRELALQVQRELEWLYGPAGGRIASCVGGMDIRREAKALAAGCHIVVGTPGRLKDHIQRKRLELSGLKAVVLDEADEMLDLGFREDLEFILGATPPERRTLMFSATIAHEIATLAKTFQRDALRISTTNTNQSHVDIEYRAIRVMGSEVERAIVNVLRFYDSGATLVFCSTREGVKRLHGSLVERGFAAVALSGELSQAERTNALQSLRDGRSRVCVATDVAARGLDLPDLGLVIHADLPNDRETLLHRSGRTGRAGRKGICLLMVPPFKRRRAEMLIGSAKINATWMGPPTADDVRAKDQERMLNDATFTEEAGDEDQAIAQAMLAKHAGEGVALALVRVLRSRLPAPEDVSDPGSSNVREHAFKDRKSFDRGDRNDDRRPFEKRPFRERDAAPFAGGDEGGDRGTPRDRLKPEETVWFRINIGRDRNAEPRWMIPLICKAGGITKAEIGSIRIFDTDSRFQIAKDRADAFAQSVIGKNENNTTITRADDKPPAAGFKPASGFKKAPFKPRRDEGASHEPYAKKPRFERKDERFEKPHVASAPVAAAPPSPVAAEPAIKPHFTPRPPRPAGTPYVKSDRPAGAPYAKSDRPAHASAKPSFRKPDRDVPKSAALDPNKRPFRPDMPSSKPYKAKKKAKAQ